MTSLIIILIGIFTGAVSFISSSGPVVTPSESGIRRVAKRGWLFIISSTILVFLPVVQNFISEREANKKEIIAKREQDWRDSTLRRSYDSSTTAIILNMSEALAKYGLKYDSAKKSIEQLVKDSARRNVTIIQGNDPLLLISNIVAENKNEDSAVITFTLHHENSPYNLTLDCTPIVVRSGKYKNIGQLKNHISVLKLDGAGELEGFKTVFLKPSFENFPSTVFFYFKGKYTNRYNTKLFPFEKVYSYSFSDKRFGSPISKIEAEVIDFAKTVK